MTVLFGALGFAPDAAQALLDRMRARLDGIRAAGPEADQLTTEGVALAVRTPRYAQRHARRPRPLARDGPHSLALTSRLDDRPRLLAAAAQPLDSPASDADLLLAAYRRHGANCVQHLVGDWVFALWDGDRQRLLLARNATESSTLYWWQGGGERLLFASSLPALLAAGPVPARPNPRWIAGLLSVFSDPAHPNDTAFEDIQVLQPGQMLLAQSGHVEVRRWWRPETLAPLDATPLPELEAQFLALYDDAVRQRLRRDAGHVAAMLSGGLDSGSVAALAAPALAEQGETLTAFVHVPQFDVSRAFPRRTTNEWALAQATAQHVGNVHVVACSTPHVSPLEGLRLWLDRTMAPSHAAGNWYWLIDILGQAHAKGASILLMGQGGNSTVSFDGNGSLWPRLASMHFGRVLQELRSEEGGWMYALHGRLIKPALRPAWLTLKRACSPRIAWDPRTAFLNPASPHTKALVSAMAEANHDPLSKINAPRIRAQWRLGLRRDAGRSAGLSEVGHAHDIEVRDPTRDQRIVELCWRLPDELFWSHGRYRGLVRSTMHSRLPDVVRNCRYRGLQSADLRQRLQEHSHELTAAVASVSRHPLVCEWIDVPTLNLSVHEALRACSSQSAPVAPDDLLRALAAAQFVARHD